MAANQQTLDHKIEFLKGVGPVKGALLNKELGIFTFRDILHHYPSRYVDKTRFHKIKDITVDSDAVQLKGIIRRLDERGQGRSKRLVVRFRDDTGAIDLVWFKGANWMAKSLTIGAEYIVYGKINVFNNAINLPHPEIEPVSAVKPEEQSRLGPVYPSTEKLNNKGLGIKGRRRIIRALFDRLHPADLPENLPGYILEKYKFLSRFEALKNIHLPKTEQILGEARRRLKFEELFFLQLRLLQVRNTRKETVKGYAFPTIGAHFNQFYQEKIPFELTGAQKRVIKEIRRDLSTGVHMNRLLQGDVGSGKTMVGLMCMLIALDNGFQTCMMAPTEILAQQHHHSITEYLAGLDVKVGYLTGTVKGKKRKQLLESLEAGEIDILIGTHALIEDPVVFKNLGLAITDEQHRFGVAQRAKLWAKNKPYPPHILVMTATPIPRTLAMTLYGDLDVSVIDELPPGRKAVQTVHRTENHRLRVFGFMKEQIALGRQIYVVYPLIEESEKLDLKNVEEGYEAISREFPLPEYKISVVHGRMKPKDKEFEMQRFVKGETQIMVATTVIEVGVNVPNASVMVIENTERFGLSQLHQLRGRVGRGADQSFCILMSSFKLTKEARSRIQTMVNSTNGFEIAEADLKLRGPGNMEGTQQSGILNFRIADLMRDGRILQEARETAALILREDPGLLLPKNTPMRLYMESQGTKIKSWGMIS